MHREVTFTPQIEDHVAAQRLVYGRSLRTGWGRLLPAVAVGLALLALGAILADLAVGRTLSHSLMDNAVPLVSPLLIGGILAWNRRRIPVQVRRMGEQQPSLFSETVWRWNDKELVAESAAGCSRIEWGSLYGWLADDRSIVLRPQERMVLILPRRVLAPEQDADLLAALDRFAVKARRS